MTIKIKGRQNQLVCTLQYCLKIMFSNANSILSFLSARLSLSSSEKYSIVMELEACHWSIF